MRFMYLMLFFGLGSNAIATTTTPTPNAGDIDKPVNMTLMNATINLLQQGNQEIQLRETHKDLTLLVGLSGSGKSTMAHFLGDQNSTLEAYDIEDDILIRDTNQKISDGNSSLTSKTLFPELILDHETGEAMYDCPGFKDTRNTSVEIANGFFIKKLVTHASTIKILVVVKYDALKLGGSRGWFTDLVKQLLQFMRNVPKYNGAIALLVTKLDIQADDEKALNRIAGFLKKAHVHSLEEYSERKADVDVLFNSWLYQDHNGKYVNLDFFRQPEKAGLLRNMPEVVANRLRIRSMVFNNTQFRHVPCDSADFGIPLSGDATADIQKILLKLKDQVNLGISSLRAGIRARISLIESASIDALVTPEIFHVLLKATNDVKTKVAAEHVLQEVASVANALTVFGVTETVKTLNESLHYYNYLDSLLPNRDVEKVDYVGQLKNILTENNVELNVRSRLSNAINVAFSNISQESVEKKFASLNEESRIKALYAVTATAEDGKLNSLDFVESAQKVLYLNQELFHFGLSNDSMVKIVKLVRLLPDEGKLAEQYKTEYLLQTLRNQLDEVVVLVGRKAGIAELVPRTHELDFICYVKG